MHLPVSGNVISLPGSGFVWHILHSKPNAKCFLWLYGMGCVGAGCSLGLSGTMVLAVWDSPACCVAELPTKKKTNAAAVMPKDTKETRLFVFIYASPRTRESPVENEETSLLGVLWHD